MTPQEYYKTYMGGSTPTTPAPAPVAADTTQTQPTSSFSADIHNTHNLRTNTMPQIEQKTPTTSQGVNQTVPALSVLSSSGVPPINVNNAQSLQTKDKGQYNGLCQRFVEDATYGKHGIYDSAISAWNQLPNKVQGLNGVKPGDLVYFSANAGNNNDGHVGIYEGNGIFKSATSQGIEDYNINDWTKRTGQSVLGYVPV